MSLLQSKEASKINQRSNSNIDLQNSNTHLQALINSHKPLLSFRERVDVGLGNQLYSHNGNQDRASKSPSQLNLDIQP